MACGLRSPRCCRLRRLGPGVAAGGCPTAMCWPGSSMCCEPGCPGGTSPPRARLRQRGDLLAAAGRVAAGRGVGAVARSAAGARQRRWWAGLVGGQPGQHQRAGQAWGELVGANPTDRGKPGSKYHLIVDGAGLPLAVLVSAANTHDSRLLVPLVDRVGRCEGGSVGRGGALCGCTPTRPTTSVVVGGRCGSVASAPGSPVVGCSPPGGWASSGGRWSGPSPGCWSTVASKSVTSGWPRSWRGWCNWGVR